MLRFPQPSQQPSPLNALRSTFISELSKVLSDSGLQGIVTRPGPAVPSPTLPEHPEVPLEPGVSDGSGQVPVPAARLQAAEHNAASAAAIPKEGALGLRDRRLNDPHASRVERKQDSHLVRYWGDVTYSFQRDLQAFYSDCRRFLGR